MPNKKKIQVGLIFGGRSVEHDVSLSSALGILHNIDRKKYNLLPIKITKQGTWLLFDSSDTLQSLEDLKKNPSTQILVGKTSSPGVIRISPERNSDSSVSDSIIPVDVVFPLLHGSFGEDGTLQGLLKMADLPFVGCDVLASAVAMDKIIAKQLFFQNNLPSTDFIWFLRKSWQDSSEAIIQGVKKEIGFPCFVKAANSGSSVGVFKANREDEFSILVNKACSYDRKILVEKNIEARELECSVLGNDTPMVSSIGEIIPTHEFYDYKAKYEDDSTELIIPADIPEKTTQVLRSLAVKAFKTLDCAGMARVDFLLEKKSGNVYINEVNTIPGFTPISMYPKLWEQSGISYPELISRLIKLAITRHTELSSLKFYK